MCFRRSNLLNIHAIRRQQSAQGSYANGGLECIRINYAPLERGGTPGWIKYYKAITVCRFAIFISTMRWMWPSLLLLNGARSRCVHAFTACTMCGTNCFTSTNFVREFPSVHFQRPVTVTVAASNTHGNAMAGHEEKRKWGKENPIKSCIDSTIHSYTQSAHNKPTSTPMDSEMGWQRKVRSSVFARRNARWEAE